MSRVFVSNIPEKFSTQDLHNLLQQANIPFTNTDLKIQKSKRYVQNNASSGRFIVLTFETETLSIAALEAINLMVLTVDKLEHSLVAAPFIQNFKQFLEKPDSNLVITNIPPELTKDDLKELFNEFGNVLSTFIRKPITAKNAPAPKSNMGYVLFEKKEEAEQAMISANGKYLGPNQLFISKYKTLQQRMDDNADVQLLSFPADYDENAIKKYISEQIDMQQDEIFNGMISIKKDSRPEPVNSNGEQIIFTCKTKEVANTIIETLLQLDQKQFEGVKEGVVARIKLTRGMLAYKKNEESKKNKEKFAESGKNIQVFGLKTTVSQDQVKEFFGKYGEIEQLSSPSHSAIQENIFHYNILYTSQESAQQAIQNAANDEKDLPERLSATDINVKLYEQKKEVASTANRRPRQQAQNDVQPQ